MNKQAFLDAWCLILALLPGCGGTGTPPSAAPGLGTPAPAFTLRDLAGAEVKSADLLAQGPFVFVQLRGWVTYQCPLCTKQVGDLFSRAADFQAAGAQVILSYPGPAADLDAHAREFIASMQLPPGFVFALDPDLAAVGAWGLRWDAPRETAYPATFVVDPAGTVRYASVSGGHGGRAAPGDVIAAVQALGN